jgi:hypothetical protein
MKLVRYEVTRLVMKRELTRARFFNVNTYFISYYVDAQKVIISTNCSISIATDEFYSTYVYIFWHFLGCYVKLHIS